MKISKKQTIIDSLKNWIEYEENHKDSITNYLDCLEFDYQNIFCYLLNNNKIMPKIKYNAENLAWFIHIHKFEILNLDTFIYKKEHTMCTNIKNENQIVLLSAPIGEIEYQFNEIDYKIIKRYKDEIEDKANVTIINHYAYHVSDIVHTWYCNIDEILNLYKEMEK